MSKEFRITTIIKFADDEYTAAQQRVSAQRVIDATNDALTEAKLDGKVSHETVNARGPKKAATKTTVTKHPAAA